MKRSLLVAISLISVIGIASPSIAESELAINTQSTKQVLDISPFNLIQAGYQGRLANQGIPSAGRLRTAVRQNRIKAQDLVKAGIAQQRLSADTLENKSYLRNVQSLLDGLSRK